MLNFVAQYEAFQRRDPRLDGVFFVAVKTTGIYCRPVCRVRTPLARNVKFYPSAAAAERAGFRPCFRCRPEAAPFCPAWKGTMTTVERAIARPITPETGLIKAEGTVLSRGRRVGTAEGRLTDGEGRLLAHGTTTCLIFQS